MRPAAGLDAVRLASELLHRVRQADPLAGVWEAADIQWWWRMPRRSDTLEQRFWFDDAGAVGVALLTECRHAWGLDVIVAPDAGPALLESLVSDALRRMNDLGLSIVESLVRDDDLALAAILADAGWTTSDERSAITWMDAATRTATSAATRRRPLAEGFALLDRRTREREHPLTVRSGPGVERRLNELPLYDPSLDLAIVAPTGEIAAYALFWFDPVTRIGLLEPLRVEEPWQRRGLARSLVAAGLDRLAERGVRRFKVGFATEAGRNLYLGVGFEIGSWMTNWIRRQNWIRR